MSKMVGLSMLASITTTKLRSTAASSIQGPVHYGNVTESAGDEGVRGGIGGGT